MPAQDHDVWALVVAVVSMLVVGTFGALSIGGGIVAVVLARNVRRHARSAEPPRDTTTATTAFWIGLAAVSCGILSFLVGPVIGVLLDLGL